MSTRETADFSWKTFQPDFEEIRREIKVIQVNQFFKPSYLFPEQIVSTTDRNVVEDNREVISTFHCSLR